MWKVTIKYPDGDSDELDDRFDTETEARAAGQNAVDAFAEGGEVQHLHNPGDYPEDDESADYEVDEVSD